MGALTVPAPTAIAEAVQKTAKPVSPFLELWRPHRYKVFYGGRGSGKTYAVARALITLATRWRIRVLCCREIQNSIRDSSYQVLKDMAERLGVSGRFRFLEKEIRGVNGSSFVFTGLYKQDNSIRSKEGFDICWVEEASAVSMASWDVLIPTIRKEGSEIWVTFNPISAEDATNKLFLEESDPNIYVRKVNYNENPYFPDVLRAEMEKLKAHDYEKYLHVWEGEPLTVTEAQIFRNCFTVQTFADDLYEKADRLFFGADFGYAEDPSTLVRCFIFDNCLYVEYEAYGQHVMIDNLKAMYSVVPGYDTWPIRADCARPEVIAWLVNRDGLDVTGAPKWKNSILDGIDYIRAFDRVIIHPRCVHTAEEFVRYSYCTDPRTGEILPKVEDKNNHCIDALRYALGPYIQNSFEEYSIGL